jgi:nucleotide-binding universal stress UspA family protein
VLVIRPPAEQIESEPPAATTVVPRPVLVGVDGSPSSETAIEFAFQEASLRHVPLIAVHVWWESSTHIGRPDLPGAPNLDAAREESKRLLTELTAETAKKYPDVPVELRAVESMNPSHALIEASDEAGLVVVGSRGRGGFAGLLLGSTGRDLVGHANSPVAVVRPRHSA